jgi:hypothetical protein
MRDGLVRCDAPHDCSVLLSASFPRKVIPQPSEFRPGRAADFYPEYEDEEYGFKSAWLSLWDHWLILKTAATRHPLLLIVSGVAGMLCSAASAATRSLNRPDRYIARHITWVVSALVWISMLSLHMLYAAWGSWFLYGPPFLVFSLSALAFWWVFAPQESTSSRTAT